MSIQSVTENCSVIVFWKVGINGLDQVEQEYVFHIYFNNMWEVTRRVCMRWKWESKADQNKYQNTPILRTTTHFAFSDVYKVKEKIMWLRLTKNVQIHYYSTIYM